MIAELPAYIQVLLFLVGIAGLVKGADWFVDGVASIAEKFGMSPFLIGLTIVAIGTSAPEFAVSSYAAWSGSGDIALANVVGSNIFNLGFILALCAAIKPLTATAPLVYRDGGVLLVGSILMMVFAKSDSQVSRVEGSILILGLVFYLLVLIRQGAKKTKETVDEVNESDPPEVSPRTYLIVFMGLAGLLIGSRLIVDTGKSFAYAMGWSEWLVGVTIIAVGTSLPELVTAVASVAKGKSEIGVGGLVGSDIFNIFGVIGLSGVITPIESSPNLQMPFNYLVFSIVLTLVLLRWNWSLGRRKAIVVLLVASARYAYEIIG